MFSERKYYNITYTHCTHDGNKIVPKSLDCKEYFLKKYYKNSLHGKHAIHNLYVKDYKVQKPFIGFQNFQIVEYN